MRLQIITIRKAFTKEPQDIAKYSKPEETFQTAIRGELNRILSIKKSEGEIDNFIILENFGLDFAIFIHIENKYISRFFELKAFVKQRNSCVGFGDREGKGNQVDLLSLNNNQLLIANNFIKWILVNTDLGILRYFFFDNYKARLSVSAGTIKRGQQNNINVNELSLNVDPISWDDLSTQIENFLLT